MAAKMEVDEEAGPSNVAISNSVMASSGTTGSVTVALHPLVIMNISEHWTRIRAQEGKPTQGKSNKLNLSNSTALPHFIFITVV